MGADSPKELLCILTRPMVREYPQIRSSWGAQRFDGPNSKLGVWKAIRGIFQEIFWQPPKLVTDSFLNKKNKHWIPRKLTHVLERKPKFGPSQFPERVLWLALCERGCLGFRHTKTCVSSAQPLSLSLSLSLAVCPCSCFTGRFVPSYFFLGGGQVLDASESAERGREECNCSRGITFMHF